MKSNIMSLLRNWCRWKTCCWLVNGV